MDGFVEEVAFVAERNFQGACGAAIGVLRFAEVDASEAGLFTVLQDTLFHFDECEMRVAFQVIPLLVFGDALLALWRCAP